MMDPSADEGELKVEVEEEVNVKEEVVRLEATKLPSKSDRFFLYKQIEAEVERRIWRMRQLPDTRRTSFFTTKKEEVDKSGKFQLGCRDRQIKYLKYSLMPMVSSCLMLELQDLQDSSMDCPDKVEEPIECITMFVSNILLLSKGNYDARLRSVVKNICVNVLEEASKEKPEVPTVNSRNLYFLKKEDRSKQKKDVIMDLDETYEKLVQQTSYTPTLTSRKQATLRFEHIETSIATDILRSLIATDPLNTLPESGDQGRPRRIMLRSLQIGSVGLVVGSLFAITGGLAAPALVAAITAFGVGSGSAVFATLTSTTALAALFGVSGGSIAGYKMKKRTEQLTEWRIRNESRTQNQDVVKINGLHATVAVSGWLIDRVDFQRSWGIMPTDPAIQNKTELLQRFFAVHGPEKVQFCEALLKAEQQKEKEMKKAEKQKKEKTTTVTENASGLWVGLERRYGRDPDHLVPFDTMGEEPVLPMETERIIAASLQKFVWPNSIRLGEIYINNSTLTKMEAVNAENFGMGFEEGDEDSDSCQEKSDDEDPPAECEGEILAVMDAMNRQVSTASLESSERDAIERKVQIPSISNSEGDSSGETPRTIDSTKENKVFDRATKAEVDHEMSSVPNQIGGSLTDHVESPFELLQSTSRDEDAIDQPSLVADENKHVENGLNVSGPKGSSMPDLSADPENSAGLNNFDKEVEDDNWDVHPIKETNGESSVGGVKTKMPMLVLPRKVVDPAALSLQLACSKNVDDNAGGVTYIKQIETKETHVELFGEQHKSCSSPDNIITQDDIKEDASVTSKGSKESDKTTDSREELAKRDHDVVIWDWQASFGGELYTVTWETDLLTRLCRVVNLMFKEIGRQGAQQLASFTVLGGVVAAVHIPAAMGTCLNVIDDPYQLISFRSDYAGIELANCLLHSEEHRPVSLVGYSFGTRVIFSCLQELARHQLKWEKQQRMTREKPNEKSAESVEDEEPKKVGWRIRRAAAARAARKEWVNYAREPASIVEDVCLIGMPRLIDLNEWVTCREIVGGRVINAYSQSDFFLKYLFQIRTWKGVSRLTAGTYPIQGVEGVENYDVTAFVSTHGRYPLVVPQILQEVGFGQPSYFAKKVSEGA